MTAENEICAMDAVSLAAQIRNKKISPVEVIDAVLARMERLEPALHAFCTPTPELARETAKQIEKKIMQGKAAGPLAGVPYGVKDLICTKGIRTVSGSLAYADFVPDEDDVVVERMSNAGAVILGKTNVPEFGYSGVGHNPVFATTRCCRSLYFTGNLPGYFVMVRERSLALWTAVRKIGTRAQCGRVLARVSLSWIIDRRFCSIVL
jgi:aspartyl-tRNA(Asn)/glutamyl-tRNA(Gln) amidotransferase subunit A